MDNERLARMQLADKIDEADGCPDELEDLIAEMTEKDPDFPRKLEEAMTRQTLMHILIQERKRQRITQKILAVRMETKQSTLARMEQGKRDPRISTLQRYAASLGKRLTWQLVDA
jgi:ribosome-binding protein aMBF1 (putative translation factor)